MIEAKGRLRMEKNFDAFNQVIGLVFDQLYRAFPVAIEVDYGQIATKLDISISPYKPPSGFISPRSEVYGEILPGTEMESFVDEAISFLEAEGFLQRQGKFAFRLSAKALTLLNAPLSGLEQSAGTRIIEISKQVGNEAGRAAMSEVIGQLIGAAARGFAGS